MAPDEEPVGNVYGTCTLINTVSQFFCNLEWSFGREGSIISTGTMDSNAVQTTMAVVGGTGIYKGVKGLLFQEFIAPAFVDHQVFFDVVA